MEINHSPSSPLHHSLSPNPPPPEPSDFSLKPQINGPKLTRKIKKRYPDEASSASSSSSIQRGIRIPNKRRNPRFSVRRNATDVEAIAFPLGMSIAAVLAQVCLNFYSKVSIFITLYHASFFFLGEFGILIYGFWVAISFFLFNLILDLNC